MTIVPGAIGVDRMTPLTYGAMRVTPQYVPALFALIQLAAEQGKWVGKPTPMPLPDGTVGWQIEFLYGDGRVPQTAHPGYWVFADSELNVEIFTPPEGVLRFHQNVPFEWDGLANPPRLALNGYDGTLEIRFRQPKSINGPWSYTVTRVDLADDSETELTLLDEPVVTLVSDDTFRVVGADVWLTVPGGMTAGHDYRFKVTATATSYGTTAVTPLSDTISLPAPA